ncbi:MAG: hypothetical protein QM652_06870 [Legionella sp.]|uniref:hypothetical protein n=1 Tax=Legionella sp. TaxID=459 RepID=UPI0039E4E5E3
MMVKVKGSKDGDILKARFEGQTKSLFPNLNKTKSLVLLSIRGNKYCTGEYLKAIVEKAASEFEFTTFLIADEVYWHNLCQDFDDVAHRKETLQDEAVLLGKTYFEEHLDCFLKPLGLSSGEFDAHLVEIFPLDKKAALNKTAKNYEVLFWRDWLKKSTPFCKFQSQISALYQSEPTLSKSVHQVAADFVRRHSNNSVTEELLMQSSSNYLIEESPAVMWIAASLGYNFIIYPGEIISSFSASRDYFIRNDMDNNPLFVDASKPELLVNWLEVSFIRSRSSDSHSIKNNKNSGAIDEGELTQLMKGVTAGIFSLALNKEEKIELITDVILSYQSKKSISGGDNLSGFIQKMSGIC